MVATGFGILATGWLWLDPVAGIGIAGVITAGTWRLLREALNLAMDAVPAGIDPAKVEAYLVSLPGVTEVHDLHIWAMSTTESALTVHLVSPAGGVDDDSLSRICKELHDRFGIGHSTIQVGRGNAEKPCAQAPTEVV